MAPAVAAAGISAVGGIAGSQMGAYGQEKATDEATKRQMQMNAANITSNENINNANLAFGREGLANTEAQQAADRAAYEASVGRGAGEMTAGESAFMNETGTPNAQLTQQEADIKAGTAKQLQQGAGQMSSNLAAQGIRGGASATLLNRGTGEMATNAQTDINKMKFEDEAQRQADLRAYQSQKARLGQSAGLAGVAK
jgi:hypothetical protein